MPHEEPVRLVLTEEQREIVRRLSGQQVDAIELASDEANSENGVLRLLWRISAASGIPRQLWREDKSDRPASSEPT
ncbi:MAG: hypothetical protein ACREPM_03100 [Gemmatimonadaceae bacterium]